MQDHLQWVSFREWEWCTFIVALLMEHLVYLQDTVLYTKAHSLAFCLLFNYLQLKTMKTVGERFMGQ